ncbi:SDR family oxidoreductase [Aggregatilinea lenta]|uniref:SDR family oxidoreductase n=1 Tax=Aggregatilinea lenta TaxID=913108 RepID=UPI000E5C1538|nr:SDR family oxidoreductase [Aggregatilinea lenta]
MDLGLKEAKVFVAASSSGLGAATARQFSLEGAHVVVNGRYQDRLEETAAAIRRESGNNVLALSGDLTDGEAAKTIVENAAARLGGLDVIVTNAGGPPPGTFESVSLDDWDKAFKLNVMSAVYVIRAALPYLKQSSRAAILTITSVSVKQPIDNLILSNSVRMSVAGLTKSLANELGPQGIRVNSILPGWTRTGRVTQIMESRAQAQGITAEEAGQRQGASVPLGRMGEPEEFANVAVFMCSPAASYLHGTLIPVDGGSIRTTL